MSGTGFAEFFHSRMVDLIVILTCLICILFKEYRGIEQHEVGLNPGWYVVIIILILFLGRHFKSNSNDSKSLL